MFLLGLLCRDFLHMDVDALDEGAPVLQLCELLCLLLVQFCQLEVFYKILKYLGKWVL